MRLNKQNQSGQVVLITLLIMAVVLTIGMSIVSRSIVEVKTSQQTQESARAFWLAQGELEKAIRANSAGTGALTEVDDMKYQVTKSALGGDTKYVYPELVKADTPATIWFVDHNDDGSIKTTFSPPGRIQIYWGEATNRKPAIEATFLYKNALGDYQVARYTYDPDNTTTGSNFVDPIISGITINGKAYVYGTDVIDTGIYSDLYYLKIKLINTTAGEPLAITTSAALPNQGSCYESVSVVSVSKITRRLTSCQLWPDTPAIFDNVLFSGVSI